MSSPKANIPEKNDSRIIEVDPTAKSPTTSPEMSLAGGQKIDRKSRKDEFRQAEHIEDNNLFISSKLFDQNLLAELTTYDTWMDRLRRVIERKDRHTFEM